jgi:hypothetical protein
MRLKPLSAWFTQASPFAYSIEWFTRLGDFACRNQASISTVETRMQFIPGGSFVSMHRRTAIETGLDETHRILLAGRNGGERSAGTCARLMLSYRFAT